MTTKLALYDDEIKRDLFIMRALSSSNESSEVAALKSVSQCQTKESQRNEFENEGHSNNSIDIESTMHGTPGENNEDDPNG